MLGLLVASYLHVFFSFAVIKYLDEMSFGERSVFGLHCRDGVHHGIKAQELEAGHIASTVRSRKQGMNVVA